MEQSPTEASAAIGSDGRNRKREENAMDLRRMRFLIDRLPMARFRIDKAMSQAAKCTASLTGMPRGGGGESQVERGVELLTAAREAHAAISQELYDMRLELNPIIEAMDDPLQKTAMRMRYIDGLSVREIAYRINYSESHIFLVLRTAEKKIAAAKET